MKFEVEGWREKKTITSGETKWDATKLGARMGGEVFGLQPQGLKFEQA